MIIHLHDPRNGFHVFWVAGSLDPIPGNRAGRCEENIRHFSLLNNMFLIHAEFGLDSIISIICPTRPCERVVSIETITH